MILLLDAYNILKQVSPTVLISAEQRAAFIRKVASFVAAKGHTAVIVFDGEGISDYSKKSAVCIVYAGAHASADDVLKKLCRELAGRELVLVSADRDILSTARRYNVVPLDPVLFYEMAMRHQPSIKSFIMQKDASPLIKREGHKSSAEVDELMQGVSGIMLKDEDEVRPVPRVSPEVKLSKKEKQRKKIMDKL